MACYLDHVLSPGTPWQGSSSPAWSCGFARPGLIDRQDLATVNYDLELNPLLMIIRFLPCGTCAGSRGIRFRTLHHLELDSYLV